MVMPVVMGRRSGRSGLTLDDRGDTHGFPRAQNGEDASIGHGFRIS
jgi:hypothetical protein